MASPVEHGVGTPQGHEGIVGNLKQHWIIYLIALVGAGLVYIMISNYNSQSSGATSGVGAASTGVTPGDQSGSALIDYDLGLLQQTIAAQTNVLSTIVPPTSTPTTGGGTVTPPATTPTSVVQSIFPFLKNTPGVSNNFWVYSTQQGDTAASLAQKAGWNKFGPSYFEGYRNNNAILQNIGYDFSHPNSPLPVGTKVSL